MKQTDYRHLIILIIITVTVSISIRLLYPKHSAKDPAITINRKVISKNAFNEMYSKKSGFQTINSFIDSVVIRELLIQKAIQEGIPQEESFQKSIKNHYEQSLIKILMDRKYKTIQPVISESAIDKYIELSDKIVHLTLITGKSEKSLTNYENVKQEKISILFEDLSTEVRFAVLSLNIGQTSKPEFSDEEDEFTLFRLDSLETPQPETARELNRNKIRSLLTEYKKELLLSIWVNDLKNNANVNITTIEE